MSTRSNIGYKHPVTGKYHYCYCHWDGYMSWNGRILRDNYKSLQKVKMLVNLGDISVLKKNVRPPKKPMYEDYTKRVGNKRVYVPVEKHSFETPDRNTVIAYHRDRGEPLNKPKVSDEFPVEQEWAYCFIDGRWFFKWGRMKEWHNMPSGDQKALQAFEKNLYGD
jgi:hypothetical protein